MPVTLVNKNFVRNMKIGAIIALAVIVVFLLLLTPWRKQNKTLARNGKELYESKCKSCHSLFKETVGPPMYGTWERAPSKKWVYDFIKTPFRGFQTDPTAQCLLKKYKSQMVAFNMLSDEEIDAIYDYVYSEAKKEKSIWNNPGFFGKCK